MATKIYTIISFLVVAVLIAVCFADQDAYCAGDRSRLKKTDFPSDFIFGAASSAYQCEGAYQENGKGLSIWDTFTHKHQDKISDNSNGDIAVDSYHLYKEDVKIAKNMGIKAYRFSISWPRILPGGMIRKGVNQDGIDYYNDLINQLLANGIEPFVSILHFDPAQALQDSYDGFLNRQIVDDFRDLADLLFRELGDRVKYWITINEPWTFSVHGYEDGSFAPGRCSYSHGNGGCTDGDSSTEPYIVAHHQLLAHAAAVNLYKTKYQGIQNGKIGITVVSYWFEAYDASSYDDQNAKQRALDFMLGWFMEPLTAGKYPESMRIRVGNRLPELTVKDVEMVKGSFDFIGFNYYGAIYASSRNHDDTSPSFSFLTDSEVYLTGERNGKPIGEQTRNSSRIYIYPKGLRHMLRLIMEKYDAPLVYITENGIDEAAEEGKEMLEALKDETRKGYIQDHLWCLRESIEKDGSNVNGYFVWSLMDNFEWAAGFSVRFGLNYVDYKDQRLARYPKHSAKWFHTFLTATAYSDQ